MTTYSKETALYDTGAIKNGIDDAATTASNYLTDITGEGVYVHKDDSEWDSETGDAVKITGESVEILQGGESASSFGREARIGFEGQGRIEIGSDHFKIFDAESKLMDISTSNSSVSIPTKVEHNTGFSTNLHQTKYAYVSGLEKASSKTTYPCHISFGIYRTNKTTEANYCIITNISTTNTAFTKSETGNDVGGYYWFDADYDFPQSSNLTISLPISITFSKVAKRKQSGSSWIDNGSASNVTKTLTVSISWSYTDKRVTYTVPAVMHSIDGVEYALWFARYAKTTVTAYSGSRLAPSYTLGGRDGTPGGYSSTIGYGLQADEDYQTAIGFYNSNQSDTVFEIGNGTSDDDRSNALTVDWGGNVNAAGILSAGAISSGLFSVVNVSISVSASAAGAVANSKSVSKTGYFPLGIVGTSVETGGAYSRGFYLTNEANGSCTLNARLYASSSGTKNCNVNILWLKVTA